MHPAIAAFPSAQFYGGKLMTVFDMEDGPVEFPWPDQERPIFHLNIEGRERKRE